MLILTRNKKETIKIITSEGVINVTLLNVCGKQARIGVCAPKNIEVHREEVYQRIQREKEQSNG